MAPPGTTGAPTALILRSRTERLQFLRALHTAGATAVLAVLAATLLSFGDRAHRHTPARRHHRDDARDGGDRRPDAKIRVPADGRWDDEDARLLATTFNSMTDSIARFQREVTQKERLSSLGRLSTVIAHEVRNPLMIIKTALHSLRQRDVDAATMREAAARHRRGGRAAEPDRQRGARFRAADPVRARAGRPQRAAASRRRPRGRAGGTMPAVTLRARSAVPAVDDRRRAAAHVARQRARQRASRRSNARRPCDGVRPDAPHSARRPRRLDSDARDDHRARSRHRHRRRKTCPRVFDPYFTTKRGPAPASVCAISHNIVEGLGGTHYGRQRSRNGHRGPHRPAASLNSRMTATRIDSARRRRRERSCNALGRGAARRRPRGASRPTSPREAQRLLGRALLRRAHRRQRDAGAERPRSDSRVRRRPRRKASGRRS